ncbi:MAG: 3-oxoacyl-ACP reductase [Pseudonocardiaceae bacterium]|nr:3-oxoacyl-ACP reductase [Pseudonocardiaceae bacterium]
MTDRYSSFARSPLGRTLVKQLGLPDPPRLQRHTPGRPVLDGPVLLGEATGSRAGKALGSLLPELGATVHADPADGERYAAVVFDASGITGTEQLRALYDFTHPVIRSLRPSGRLLIIGGDPGAASGPGEAAAQQALEGFVRSVGKELRHGATAQLLRLAQGGEDAAESTLRFLLSARSAYVSGQVITVRGADLPGTQDWEHPLHGQVALVTGAARGIGAAIAEVAARDGAHVVCLDVPAAGDALAAVANRVGGEALQSDITASGAPGRISEHLRQRHGGADIVVHNAGVTRDRTLGRMSEAEWDAVLGVNLAAQQRITAELVDSGTLRAGGRIVALSSMAGIAGTAGQTNYAASKAGVIGLVRAQAAQLADHPITVNAVAPGFIETEMTAAMPMLPREAGRRMNSLSQGGLPVDVAETVAWLAAPASTGVTRQVVRVCGQHLLGA